MASLSDTIFGTTPSTTTSQYSTQTPQQQAALAQLIQQLSSKGTSTPSNAYTPYTGTFTAPTSSLQNLSLDALAQQTTNEALGGPGSAKAAAQAMDQLIKKGGSPVDVNAAYDAYSQPVLKQFQDKILPMLQSSFAGSSAFGSDKLKQQEILTNNLTQNLVNERGTLQYQSQNDAMNRLLQAAGLQTSAASGSSSNLMAGMTAGAVPQQTQQADLTAQYNEFLRKQGLQQKDIDQLMSALGLQTVGTNTTVSPGSQGLAGGALNTLTAMLIRGGTGGGGIGLGGIGSSLSNFFGGASTVGGVFGSAGADYAGLLGGSAAAGAAIDAGGFSLADMLAGGLLAL